VIEVLAFDSVKLLEILAVVTGIAGSVLNARGQRSSFYVWTASNVLLAVLMIRAEYWITAGLYCTYTVINFYGLHVWRRQPPTVPFVDNPPRPA